VRVEDLDAVGQLAAQFRVPLLHQLLSSPERLVHDLESTFVV
jgi:hypothetical protein